MFSFKVIFIFVLIIRTNCFVDYSNYSLFNVLIRNKEDLRIYKELDKIFPDNKIDYWFQGKSPGLTASIFTSPESAIKLKNYLNIKNYNFNVTTKNWNEQSLNRKNRKKRSPKYRYDFQHDIFHSYDEIISFLKLQEEDNKKFVSLQIYGESYEKRPLYYIKIGYPKWKKKPMIVIDAGIHAREWVSHSSALIIIEHLIKYSRDYKKLLEKIDIIIFPVLNPDGYVYTRMDDRMWRGNRNLFDGTFCGVDLNRNYPFKWKYSSDRCQIHSGSSKLSEVESMYHSAFIEHNKNLIKGYISLHSYGRLILLPWSYTKKYNASDYNDMNTLGEKIKKTIENKTNVTYEVGSASNVLYEASGTSLDYLKSLDIKYVYVIELSPSLYTEKGGFIVEESQIMAIGNEALIAFDVMLHQVYSEL